MRSSRYISAYDEDSGRVVRVRRIKRKNYVGRPSESRRCRADEASDLTVLLVVIVCLIALLGWAIWVDNSASAKCQRQGGVLVQSQCVQPVQPAPISA